MTDFKDFVPARATWSGTPGATDYFILVPNGSVAKKVPSTDIQYASRTVVTKTGNYTILATDKGTYFDNEGASAEVDFTLPTAAAGLNFGFCVFAAHTLKVIAAASTKIAIGAVNSANAGNVQCDEPFSFISLYAINATQWVATSVTGENWIVT